MKKTYLFCVLACAIFLTSCTKESLIEGVDTPYKFPDYDEYKGWLMVTIKAGSLGATCKEIKVFTGSHYLGKLTQKHIVDAGYQNQCSDSKPLRISLPPGTYSLVFDGDCGSLKTTKKIEKLFCTFITLE